LSGYRRAEAFGEELVRGLPVGAVIINFTSPPEWRADAVFGSYYQKAKGARPDVRVVPPLPVGQVLELLRRGTSVYLYHPVSLMVQRFDVLPDGPLYRVKARAGPRQ
jgi:hypothetical protein